MRHSLSRPSLGRNRRWFWPLLLAGTCLCYLSAAAHAGDFSQAVSLAGSWRFQLDREDAGVREQWFARKLDQRIQLPGALQNQGFGDDITPDTPWVGDVAIERWKRAPQYDPYRQPGHIKVPFFLQPEKHYVGAAWYQRDIDIPAAWQGQRVVLTLERPHWETRLWVDAQLVGTNDSLCTPHVYDLGTGLRPGKHTLTVRVDNRLVVEVGPMAHSVTDHSQGDWNGIVGNLTLAATSPVWVDDLQVYPDLATQSVKVQGRVGNATGQAGRGSVRLEAKGLEAYSIGVVGVVAKKSMEVAWSANGGIFETTLALGTNAALWDEFRPTLYRLTAALEYPEEALAPASPLDKASSKSAHLRTVPGARPSSAAATSASRPVQEHSNASLESKLAAPGDGRAPGTAPASALDGASAKSVVFGLREIGTRDRQFILNGQPVFFRGTLECCVFPRTGYPPTDVDSWRHILQVCKAHGLNHMRFHSWCPPEAAFVAADELGFYYHVECGVFGRVGEGKPVDQWLYRESERVVQAYGNHPSFVLFTHGNEPHGAHREQYLAQWVNFWKGRDSRRLVTTGTAFPILPESQYHVFHGARGASDWFGRDYGADFASLTAPVIVHEMGQWCVYPNFDETKKYTGPLKPKNFDIFRDSLSQHGMLGQWRDFLRASGRLQVLCYKEEIEAALGHAGIGGLQLLDLHDFPGQGTALVGVLDPFWDSKGYVTPEEYRRFCGLLVPLARLPKRTWTTAETLTAEVQVAQFGPKPLSNAVVSWKLVGEAEKVVASGQFAPRTLPLGQDRSLGDIRIDLSRLAAPSAYKLVVRVGTAENDWNVWVYPAQTPPAPPAQVLVASALDEATLARLDAGGKVVLFPERLSWDHPKLYFEPVFWNRYMFNVRPPQTLGLLIAGRHPALAGFPTESFQDWQWQEIVTQAHAVVLDGLPGKLRPIVQPIDDWNSNRRLGLIFECRMGSGRLLVCSADLQTHLEQRPAARQLRQSLLAYAASKDFAPSVQVPRAQLVSLFSHTKATTLVQLGAKVIETDSEDSEHGHAAACALDGDADTFWHSRGQDPLPHFLVLDLGHPVKLRGLSLLSRQDHNEGRATEVEAFCSDTPQTWGRPIADAKWRSSDQLQTLYFPQVVSARYVKVVVRAAGSGPSTAIAELDVLSQP